MSKIIEPKAEEPPGPLVPKKAYLTEIHEGQYADGSTRTLIVRIPYGGNAPFEPPENIYVGQGVIILEGHSRNVMTGAVEVIKSPELATFPIPASSITEAWKLYREVEPQGLKDAHARLVAAKNKARLKITPASG